MAAAARWASFAPAVAERTLWPRTTRVLPWLAVAAIATVILVPIDSMTLPVPLPFDARPDRLLLVACFAAWALIVAALAPARPAGTGYRYGLIEVLLLVFAAVAVLSVMRNLAELETLGEASLAIGKLVLLGSFVAFYLLLVGTIRPSELPAVVQLVVALATLAAIGTIVEFATGRNFFFTLAGALSPPGTRITSGDLLVSPGGRPDVTGPARHGLAVSAMLAMLLPLAVAGAAFAAEQRERWGYRIAALIIFAACITTFRRSGVVLPFLACSALVIGGGRRMLPVAAVFGALLLATPLLAPGAVSEVVSQFSSSNQQARESIEGRTSDYDAVVPDLRAGLFLGRGFGSYEARRYRFLDNQYLTLLIETGIVGTAAWVLLIVAGAVRGLRVGLSRDGPAHWIGLAAFGSCLAFLAANAFFDALAFPQAPYVFLLVVALAGIARRAQT